jgi:hypothetical protein
MEARRGKDGNRTDTSSKKKKKNLFAIHGVEPLVGEYGQGV